MSGGTTVIRKGIEVKRFEKDESGECDLCPNSGKGTYYLWDSLDVPFVVEVGGWVGDPQDTLLLCALCDKEELEKCEPTSKDGKYTSLPQGSYTGHGAPWQNFATTKKCLDPHFFKVTGPEGYGYLRLASERGGKNIDPDCDYALFFSTGWKRDIMDPDVEIYTPGNKPAVPDLGQHDRSNWPSMAFVYWADYKAPNPDVVRYAKWTAEQWRSGKSIQFGCMGGHGRTGTFIAMVLVEALGKTGQEGFDWVREKYCADAIEGKAQEDFVKNYTKDFDPDEAVWS